MEDKYTIYLDKSSCELNEKNCIDWDILLELVEETDTSEKYKVREKFGEGKAEVYYFLGSVLMVVYEFEFNFDIDAPYLYSEDHFELNYCIEGEMETIDKNDIKRVYRSNELSLTMGSKKEGKNIFKKNEKYNCITMITKTPFIESYFGEKGMNLWITCLDGIYMTKETPIGIPVSNELKDSFIGMKKSNLEYSSKAAFMGSKIMDVLKMIMFYQDLIDHVLFKDYFDYFKKYCNSEECEYIESLNICENISKEIEDYLEDIRIEKEKEKKRKKKKKNI